MRAIIIMLNTHLLSEAKEALQFQQPKFRRGKTSSLILEESGEYQQTLREKYTGQVRPARTGCSPLRATHSRPLIFNNPLFFSFSNVLTHAFFHWNVSFFRLEARFVVAWRRRETGTGTGTKTVTSPSRGGQKAEVTFCQVPATVTVKVSPLVTTGSVPSRW